MDKGSSSVTPIRSLEKEKGKMKIFKTITLGVHKSAKAYREALSNDGFPISEWASNALNKIRVSQSKIYLDLVAPSVEELGFREFPRLNQIYAMGKKFGFELCPPEVGPALCLARPDQPYRGWLWIAMKPIFRSADHHFRFRFFRVGHPGYGEWSLDGHGYVRDFWKFGACFVFVKPRSKPKK